MQVSVRIGLVLVIGWG